MCYPLAQVKFVALLYRPATRTLRNKTSSRSSSESLRRAQTWRDLQGFLMVAQLRFPIHGPWLAPVGKSPLGALLDTSATSALSTVVDTQIHTPPDISLSDDSLGLTPPKPTSKLGHRPPRGRSGSVGGTVEGKLAIRRRSLSTRDKRQAGAPPRPPSPALGRNQVVGPRPIPPRDATTEARISAL